MGVFWVCGLPCALRVVVRWNGKMKMVVSSMSDLVVFSFARATRPLMLPQQQTTSSSPSSCLGDESAWCQHGLEALSLHSRYNPTPIHLAPVISMSVCQSRSFWCTSFSARVLLSAPVPLSTFVLS